MSPAWTSQAAATGCAGGRVHGSDINLRAPAQHAEYFAVANRIAADGHSEVLDWGCGYGQMTRLLIDRGLRVTSIDYDPGEPEPVSRPLERFPGLEAIRTGDPVRLPFANESFDAVLSMGVLEHVSDPDASLDEIHRVLRPGGVLYCHKLPNRLSWLEAIARRSGRMYFHGQLPDDRLYDLSEARRIVERHNFEPVWARRTNMLPLTLTGRMAQRLAPAIWLSNRTLSRIPLLNAFATNVELSARRSSRSAP
jgi:SAM-dependent methyltransferase